MLNDDIAGAEAIPDVGSLDRRNTLASAEPGEPAIGTQAAQRTAWFTLDDLPIGESVSVDTCGTGPGGLDTVLGVFTPSLSVVTASDDVAGCGPGSRGSRASFTATTSRAYVAVDGKAGATGAFRIRWTRRPANDDREHAG